MEQDAVQAVKNLIDEYLPGLLDSGENWKITLHGGRSGDVRHEIQRFGQTVPPKTYKSVK